MSLQSRDTQCVVFDVDGVIVDTKDLIFESYALAGVDMPESAFGSPWRDWLIDAAGSLERARIVHAVKTAIYRQLMIDRPPRLLPAAQVVKTLVADGLGQVGFLTGASLDAVGHIIAGLGFIADNTVIHYECTVDDKRFYLSRLCMMYDTVVYVDDDLTRGTAAVCSQRPGLQARLIHYTDQTEEELMEEIWTP